MKTTNIFNVKKVKENNITVEEERKKRSSFAMFFLRNGKLIFLTTLVLSITIFIVAISYTISGLKDSTVVEHVSNGTIITFDSTDNSILNGTPITKEYASKLFTGNISEYKDSVGVIIKDKETTFNAGKIIFYSDKTALIKYNDGRYVYVYSVSNSYGVREDGTINKKAVVKSLTGELKTNNSLGIELLYLSNGMIEITKGSTTIMTRNSDIVSNDNEFYTTTSVISLPIKEDAGKIYYSNGIIKENNSITINNETYNIIREKTIQNNIKLIYYENNLVEIKRDNFSIITKKPEHIKYSNNKFEIIDNTIYEAKDIKDLIDIKSITIQNTNDTKVDYMIVLEETEDYSKYNIKRINPSFINQEVLINGRIITTEGLTNNLKDTQLAGGLTIKNSSYLLYEGELAPLEKITVKLGLWISYENITNEYMNSAYIGTIKVYVQSLG